MVGCDVDHNDDIPDEKLSYGLQQTSELWKKAYKDPYILSCMCACV